MPTAPPHRSLMNPLDWLPRIEPAFAELSGEERDEIGAFVFLWSLFEARVLHRGASARAIVNVARRWSERGVLTQDSFLNEQTYFRNRFCPDGHFSDHFHHLNLRRPDNEDLVRRFLKQECLHAWEDVAGLFIVVYRLRNNLFHGVKWAYGIQGQHENFRNANTSLVRALELDGGRY